jgi:DNA-binding NarL/FixJ family response regulator
MHPETITKKSVRRNKGILLDEKQWLYIRNRYKLSSREVQAAILLCRGFSNEEIANALNIKQGTVKTHLRNLYRSFHVNGKVLLILAIVDDVLDTFYTPVNSSSTPLTIQQIQSGIDSKDTISQENKLHH